MKLLLLLFATPFLFLKQCNSDKLETLNSKIEYEISTRGTYKKILIENQKMFISNSRKEASSEITVSNKDWNELISLFEAINLEKIQGITSETKDRASDRSYHANFLVEKNEKVYKTDEFDRKNPPKEIASFIQKLETFLQ